MTDDDSKLVDIFMEAQARPIGRSFSENILAGIRAVLAYRSTEADKRDAARYRWLRAQAIRLPTAWPLPVVQAVVWEDKKPEAIDSVIDAAMRSTGDHSES